MKKIFVISFLVLLFAIFTNAQRINKITSPCPAPSKLSSFIRMQVDGTIRQQACAGFANIFTGDVDFSGATVTGLPFPSGTGTATHIPIWTSSSTLGDSPITFTPPTYTFDQSGGGASFLMSLTPGTLSGDFSVGDQAGGDYMLLNKGSHSTIVSTATGGTTRIGTLSGGGNVDIRGSVGLGRSIDIGDVGLTGNQLRLQVSDNTNSVNIIHGLSAATFGLTGVKDFNLQRTITPTGTTGARTIHKPNGTVNFAAGASQLTVTDNMALPTSTIQAMAQFPDTTCFVTAVFPSAGGFTIYMSAPCTSETPVAFWVWN